MHVPGKRTGGEIAEEFLAALGSPLSADASGKEVVVFRLEQVGRNQIVSDDETCVVCLSSSNLGCGAIEETFGECEDLRLQCSRLQEALVDLGDTLEATERDLAETSRRAASLEEKLAAAEERAVCLHAPTATEHSPEERSRVKQENKSLRQHLTTSESIRKETEDTLNSLRCEFMQLLQSAGSWPTKQRTRSGPPKASTHCFSHQAYGAQLGNVALKTSSAWTGSGGAGLEQFTLADPGASWRQWPQWASPAPNVQMLPVQPCSNVGEAVPPSNMVSSLGTRPLDRCPPSTARGVRPRGHSARHIARGCATYRDLSGGRSRRASWQ